MQQYREAIAGALKSASGHGSEKNKAAALQWAVHLKTLTVGEVKKLIDDDQLKYPDPDALALNAFESDENRCQNSTATAKHASRSAVKVAAFVCSNVASGLVEHTHMQPDAAQDVVETLKENDAIANCSEAAAGIAILDIMSKIQNDAAAACAIAEFAGMCVGDRDLKAACARRGCDLKYTQGLVDELRARVPDFTPTRAHSTEEICEMMRRLGHNEAESREIEAYLRSEGVLTTGKEIEALRIIVAHLLSGYATVCVRALAISNASGISARLGKGSPASEAAGLLVMRQLLNKVQVRFSKDLNVKDLRYARPDEAAEMCKKAQEDHWRKRAAIEALRKIAAKRQAKADAQRLAEKKSAIAAAKQLNLTVD